MIGSRGLLAATVAVALVAGAAIGYNAGRERPTPTVAAHEAGGEYLLLLHETPATVAAVQDEGLEKIVTEYAEWAGGLARQGRLIAAEKLTDEPRWAGAAAEGSSAISGYFVVRAEDPETALRTANESPHARRGGLVEVRAIDRGD